MILRANYEKPIDSAQDIIERNMRVFTTPYADGFRDWMMEDGNLPEYRKIGKQMNVPSGWQSVTLFDSFKTNPQHKSYNSDCHMKQHPSGPGRNYAAVDPDYCRNKESLFDKDMMEDNTHVFITGKISPNLEWHVKEFHNNRFWRSKERISGQSGYNGYLTRKRWKLNEVYL